MEHSPDHWDCRACLEEAILPSQWIFLRERDRGFDGEDHTIGAILDFLDKFHPKVPKL